MQRRRTILRDRAAMFAKARAFFHDRAILEVDCPLITKGACVDAHIDLIPVEAADGTRYLHSSPEYGMKRLIAEGLGNIYQLNHVFRQGEESPKHNPEFAMAEWYRLDLDFLAMIEETLDFIRLFLGDLPSSLITYRGAFQRYVDIDYVAASCKELKELLISRGCAPYQGIEEEGKDALLNLILGSFIEPHLGKDELCVLAYYPSSQAALAKTVVVEGEAVAERFEIYYKGMELANGYHELTCEREQRRRLEEANRERKSLGKSMLPIDEHFLAALSKGLPACCGVAVGIDRLMMLRHGAKEIGEVMPFGWQTA